MGKFQEGDTVIRTTGNYKGSCIGSMSVVKGSYAQGIALDNYDGFHDEGNFRMHSPAPAKLPPQHIMFTTQLKGESNMNKAIINPHKEISKIIFLYDNGKKHHAAKIKKFNASTKDIDGTECIEYSNHTGAHRVYRNDLAAITFVCEDGYTTTQKLMDKVVVEADNARMYKKAR